MIRPDFFIESLKQQEIEYFAGVPDSLLKQICAYMAEHLDKDRFTIAANEGGAVALAAGYHIATGKIACVYMQNSGEGNIINPLASLTDREVYRIPMLLLIGWRGRPGVHDEPQHVKQGKITTGLLNVMGVDYEILNKDEAVAEKQIQRAAEYIHTTGCTYALVVEKDTFDTYTKQPETAVLSLGREEAIRTVVASLPEKAAVVSTTGMISRELFEIREARGEGHEKDFLTVGSMGFASQIALGIALEKKDRKVYCFDGDGAVLMHLGGMAIVGSKAPENYIHLVFNNGAHDSVGGQPTVGLSVDLPAIAKAVGYTQVFSVDSREDLENVVKHAAELKGPVFIEVKVKKGNRKDLGRPTTTPRQNKEALMKYLK